MKDNLILFKLGHVIASGLPLKVAYKISRFISDIHYFFAKEDRQNVTENFKVIFPQKSEKEISKIRKEVFRNFAKYLVDFFRFSKLNSTNIIKLVKVENLNFIDQALAKGKGAVLATAHIGNWELGGVTMGLLGYPIWAVALPHKDSRVDQYFNHQRTSKRLMTIPFGKAAKQCLKVLSHNSLLALAGDREFASGGVRVDFFGRQTNFPKGPAAFSIITGSPIIPGFTIRNKDDSFTLIFEKPIEFKASKNREGDIKELTMKYKSVIERYILRYPEQWYMFKKF